jgi:alkylation response protein AidB-like acyl-CoA dehydrogenase
MKLSQEEQLIQESIEKLGALEIAKYQSENYYNTVPRALFESLSSLGLAGLAIPEEFGGSSASATTSALVYETLARFDLGPAVFMSVHAMVSGLIARFGSDQQRSQYLPQMAKGELLGAFALTEPKAGSDASSLTTEARRDGDSFIIKGSKCYITSAGFADLYLVFARTSDSEGNGISSFLIPASTAGLTIGKAERKMGCELSPIASLYFDDARIPKEALLGPLHGGYKAALSGLAGGRVNIAACANGLSKAAIELARKYLNERDQFGKPLYDFQGLQFMLADMYCKAEASQLLVRKAAEDLDDEKLGGTSTNSRLSSSVAKCFATDAAMSITTDAVQLLGGAGYIKEYSVERLMRDAKMLQIVEGTNQIQRIIIARELRP